MEVLILEVFVSLALVAGSILLFAQSSARGDHKRGGHLALLPLDDADPVPTQHLPSIAGSKEGEDR